ncbi:hypothetical protein D9742_06300 [Escherichia sp. E1V33]|nr:hypothetical protein D9742_06300 [Escherichia sp. E1V33]TBR64480.1 hypothetical protein D9735_15150 [Escherichia sp. E1S7]
MRRSLHLEDEHFTGLTRFLSAPGNKGHGFGSLHIPFVDQDRVFTLGIAASQKFLEGYAINQK